MKQVDTLLHFTNNFEILKKILKEGFKASYAMESLGRRRILVPMVSFSNLLFRDIGEHEVVNYGHYGIGIRREDALKLDINPVIYLYENSQIDRAIQTLVDLTIIPQLLEDLKAFTQIEGFTKITDQITFNPLLDEVRELVNSIDSTTSDQLISAIAKYSRKAHENVYHQILLSKPYRVKNKNGDVRIAYNEREWRKGFAHLGFIFEKNFKGLENADFQKWTGTPKPHFNQPENILSVSIEQISHIVLAHENEIPQMRTYLQQLFPQEQVQKLEASGKLKIKTLVKHQFEE
ncbi:abortive infection system antitoxin AbiGi family protein [Flagellimonas pacifica]|uniref:Putative abortive phage resistance protein AbiGi, antitoxin n=1 Tax=Flagellimonas pacifica TaxID=1247520 RepID=A0A285MQT4_9FLAO|nr:abortive infection system antitoxin AbiGi family protein [Allomuricauda parva]SNY99542.1 Putative abortive phage resistance protein AbiGi, antitoxin [Allomuricauda parva]